LKTLSCYPVPVKGKCHHILSDVFDWGWCRTHITSEHRNSRL